MFYPVMKVLRTRSFELVVLLALFLPLQGLAAAWSCETLQSASPVHAASPAQHCPHGLGAVQHHDCGTCCLAAIAAAPLRIALPRSRPDMFFPRLSAAPTVELDRLDRPPRSYLS
jgi:hypothetical protein